MKTRSKKTPEIIDNTKLGGLSISILIISACVVIFSFFAPAIFVKSNNCGIDFSDKGQIGDTIGGIMNPFIAISGVLLTFLAFFIQYKSNKLQREQFRLELVEQNKQFKKSQFENQFYEMLKLHKENVNDLEIKMDDELVKGRRVFEFLIRELELCYFIAKLDFPDADLRSRFNEAYGVFFHGLNNKVIKLHKYFKDLSTLQSQLKRFGNWTLVTTVRRLFEINWEYDLKYSILNGYSSELSNYYRHLFQTVKYVSSQEELIVTYEEKRNYLRILRAQLSNQEQAMIFYNWYSGFGKQWENGSNNFFTDYRMIHNLYQELLIPDILIANIPEFNKEIRTESGRKIDSLFEFQDWER
jgi:hypothetical protein